MDITALAASPVSESRPAGADAKYEPEYEALTAEIAKLSSVSQSAPISWQDVADNGAAILAQKSKDISVAAYTAVALAHIDGARGFLDGVNLLRGICENFWEDAFPPKAKMRRRLNAYEWWHERALEQLRKENQQPIPAELSAEMTEAMNGLDSLVGTLMEDAQPLRDIKEAIRAIKMAYKELFLSNRTLKESLELLKKSNPTPEVMELITFCENTKRGITPARMKFHHSGSQDDE